MLCGVWKLPFYDHGTISSRNTVFAPPFCVSISLCCYLSLLNTHWYLNLDLLQLIAPYL